MRLISYCLFDNPSTQRFEKLTYIRTFYLNCRMNNLLFPDWITHLEVSLSIAQEYEGLFNWLRENNRLHLTIRVKEDDPLCKAMLWRMEPIFTQDVSHVLCRDTDALGTYREAVAVQQWIESGECCLSLHDNPAHSGLMGGMVGFNTSKFKAYSGLNSWSEMVAGFDLSKRGSDQHLLNQRILPKIRNDVRERSTKNLPGIYDRPNLPGVKSKFWESNLCAWFIGSAGCNEFETVRFLKRLDPEPAKYEAIEKQYSDLFYWWK